MNVLYRCLSRTARASVGMFLVLTVLAVSANAGGPLTPLSTPEIDPGAVGSALTLLIGGAFWLTGRSRKS